MSEEDVKVLAYDHLAGSCDCYGDDPCESCQEFVEAFSIGYRAGCADAVKEAKAKFVWVDRIALTNLGHPGPSGFTSLCAYFEKPSDHLAWIPVKLIEVEE